MACVFFEEIVYSKENLILSNLSGFSESLHQNNNLYISGETESSLVPGTVQKITIMRYNDDIDGIYLDKYNLKQLCINNEIIDLKKNAKLIIYDKSINVNLEIILKTIKEKESFKKIGTIILLKKIGSLDMMPQKFSYKIKTIGNFFRKSKGGAVKIVNGIKGIYNLKFIGLSYKDLNLLKKLYLYKKHFYMSLFPDNENIEEEGLRIDNFHPLIMTGTFYPKLRNNVLGIGQDINVTFEEI